MSVFNQINESWSFSRTAYSLAIRTLLLHVLAVCFFSKSAFANDGQKPIPIDIQALQQKAMQTLSRIEVDERPKIYDAQTKTRISLDDKHITEGVIEDYVHIIKFMNERNELRQKYRDPYLSAYFNHGFRRANRVVIHHKAFEQFVNKNGQVSFPSWDKKVIKYHEYCSRECAKLLLENYTQSVVFVSVHPETREILQESIREFRRSLDCTDVGPLTYSGTIGKNYQLPALGLCIKTITPERGEDLINSDGLHVYKNMSSPFWPKEFEADKIYTAPSRERPSKAFEYLKHVGATNSIEHRMLELKFGAGPPTYVIDYDFVCVAVSPALPEDTIKDITLAAVGENPLNYAYGDDRNFKVSDGRICIGQKGTQALNRKGFFDDDATVNGKLGFANILSPKQIENRLTDYAKQAALKERNTDAEWVHLAAAIKALQDFHPSFDNDIAHRIAPLLIETAKNDLQPNDLVYETLIKMPHQSMAPYLDDLKKLVEDKANAIGCSELKCSQDVKDSYKLWQLMKIFNGAGAEAAPYLDRLYRKNKNTLGSYIQYFQEASSCIGQMGSVPQSSWSSIPLSAYRLSDDKATALRQLESQLRTNEQALQDGDVASRGARLRLMQKIKGIKVELLNWEQTRPYCKSRNQW